MNLFIYPTSTCPVENEIFLKLSSDAVTGLKSAITFITKSSAFWDEKFCEISHKNNKNYSYKAAI